MYHYSADIIAFANHDSKWNKLIPSSRDMDPDRIIRFVKQMNNGQRFLNEDLVGFHVFTNTTRTNRSIPPCDVCRTI